MAEISDKEYQDLKARLKELELSVIEHTKTEESLQKTLKESQRHQDKISALLTGSRAILKYREFKDTARAIFDSCKNLIGAAAGYIALLSKDGTQNEVLFLDAGGLICTVDPSLPMPIRGLRAEAYRTGKTVYENNFSKSEWQKYMPEGHAELYNVLFAPLMIDSKVVGLLGIANKPGGFTDHDAEMASAFAELAAIALINSRLLESLKQKGEQFMRQSAELVIINSELSALYEVSAAISQTIDLNEVLKGILVTITGLEQFNVENKGGIFIIEGDRMRLIAHLGHPTSFLDLHKDMKVGDCLCGQAAKTGEIIISGNSATDNMHTISYPGIEPHGHIIVPLRTLNKVIGVLYLYIPTDVNVDKHKIDLLRSIGNQVGIVISNTQLYEETKKLSLEDPLTGLANRRLLDLVLERNFARAKRTERPFSIIMLDLDHFKKYNDTYGHSVGDKLLVELSKIVSKEIRDIDLFVRYGGEEFLILLPETEVTGAYKLSERLRKTVEAKTGITISLGVSSYHHGLQNKEDLINKADDAMYQAKQNGRNRVEVSG